MSTHENKQKGRWCRVCELHQLLDFDVWTLQSRPTKPKEDLKTPEHTVIRQINKRRE